MFNDVSEKVVTLEKQRVSVETTVPEPLPSNAQHIEDGHNVDMESSSSDTESETEQHKRVSAGERNVARSKVTRKNM